MVCGSSFSQCDGQRAAAGARPHIAVDTGDGACRRPPSGGRTRLVIIIVIIIRLLMHLVSFNRRIISVERIIEVSHFLPLQQVCTDELRTSKEQCDRRPSDDIESTQSDISDQPSSIFSAVRRASSFNCSLMPRRRRASSTVSTD